MRRRDFDYNYRNYRKIQIPAHHKKKRPGNATPLLAAVTVSMLCTSLVSAVGAHGIYQKYDTDGWAQPVVAVLMQGLAKQDFPWNPSSGAGSGSASMLAGSRSGAEELPVSFVGSGETGSSGTEQSPAGQTGLSGTDGSSSGQAGSSGAAGSSSGQTGGSSAGDSSAEQTGSSGAGGSSSGQTGSSGAGDSSSGQAGGSGAGDSSFGQTGSSGTGGSSSGQTGSSGAGDSSSGQAGSSGTSGSSSGRTGNTGTGNSSSGQADPAQPGSSAAPPTENSQPEQENSASQEPVRYEFTQVTQEYFDDALIIGDSRAEGIKLYSGWDNLTYYAEGGMTVYNMFQSQTAQDETGRKISVEEALQNRSFGKIYLEIGINEMGTGTVDSFMEAYEGVVNRLRELQPDAILYVCGIMYVKQSKSESDPIFNNPNIQARNDRIAQLADGEHIFYLDINELVTDETGHLNPDYTWDEVHLLGKYDSLWLDYFCSHGIVKDTSGNS